MEVVDLLCIALVMLFAWNRFNTPPSNRSSTRQDLYWSACAGYIACAVGLYLVLSFSLDLQGVRSLLLGDADATKGKALPAPLLATLILTTLLPTVPLLKHADVWLLDTFLTMGNIPTGAKQLAQELQPAALALQPEDIPRLRRLVEELGLPEGLQQHLRADQEAEGPSISQYRLTRVIKLHAGLLALQRRPDHARFFAEHEAEFAVLARAFEDFAERSVEVLDLALRLRALKGGPVYEELARDKRDEYAVQARALFQTMALFLARAVLRSQGKGEQVLEILRGIGFSVEPPAIPVFPCHGLTGLALLLLALFLLIGGPLAPLLPPPPRAPVAGGPNMQVAAFAVTFSHTAAVALTVWLIQRYPFFRRVPGGPPKFLSYTLCGVFGAAMAAVVCLVLVILQNGALPDSLTRYPFFRPIIWLSGALCLTLAYFCDDWLAETVQPAPRRLMEAIGCGVAMSFVAWIILPQPGGLPAGTVIDPQRLRRALPVMLLLPGLVGMLFGGFVPHIVRSARRAGDLVRPAPVRALPLPAASRQQASG